MSRRFHRRNIMPRKHRAILALGGTRMRQGIWTLGVALFATAFVFCFADPTWFQGWGTEGARRVGTRSADLDVITVIARRLMGETRAKEKAFTPDPSCLKIE